MIMPLPFLFPAPADVLLRGLNALLRREPWARDRLAAQAGKSLRLTAGEPWTLQCAIASDGTLQACDRAVTPDVVLAIPPERRRDLPGVWRADGLAGVTGLARIQGDAGLAHLVSDLARSLRWDVEDDLSRLVGDVAAVRLTRGARALADGLRQAASRAGDNVTEYLGEESGLGVRGGDFRAWASAREALETRLERLDARLRRLENRAC
ncbi:SCP2 domain-containing protein [Castellaniella ginsengisoli]|uniref:Ubiquinone biosynthesis accessory factor UbiJ n=1 Tax=Castellaniella ginsengisoli TaxID=546114 RepID=A0AB39DB96_9BURK